MKPRYKLVEFVRGVWRTEPWTFVWTRGVCLTLAVQAGTFILKSARPNQVVIVDKVMR